MTKTTFNSYFGKIFPAVLVVAAGVILTTGVWQTKVSGQELFSLPPLEVLSPIDPFCRVI